MTGRRALFLDRDGVINLDHGYVWRAENFDFVPGIFDLARAAHQQGFAIFVVTNQAGIGRGYYDEADFAALTGWMRKRFDSEGAPIEKVYFCPTHPEHGLGHYKVDSPFRKPGPGMILQAAREFDLNLSQSLLVGDNASDIAAGRSAGVGVNVLYDPRQLMAKSENPAIFQTVVMLTQVIPLLSAGTPFAD